MDFAVLNNDKLDFNVGIENAFNWLMKMQNASGNFKGGFLSGLNFGWLSFLDPFIYTEITGYGLQIQVDYARRGDHISKERALESANYLLNIQNKGGAFARGVSLPRNEIIDTSYSFDTAICISALLDLYLVESDDRYLESAKRAGYWLVGKAQNDDGSFKSKYTGDGVSIRENKWYGDGCCLHGKNAIALLKLFSQTEDYVFKSSAMKTLDWIRTLQSSDGGFRVNSRSQYVFTHAHCYATEGLLYSYFMTGNKDYLASATKAAKWLESAQKDDGGLLNLYGAISVVRRLRNALFPLRLETTDAVAQAIRIWTILYSLNRDTSFLESAHKAAAFLLNAQFRRQENDLLGGFYQHMNSFFRLPMMRTWSCIFAIQALDFLNSSMKCEEMAKEII